MQRWARRLASSWSWDRSTKASIASGVSISANRPVVRAASLDLRAEQPDGLRQDVVSTCLQALQLFEGMEQQRFPESFIGASGFSPLVTAWEITAWRFS
jgi:hypothetical protein